MDDAEKTEPKQDKRKTLPQLFKPGQSGNPAGRPPGTISIMGRIKEIWRNEPERFEQFVKEVMEDKMLRRELVQQIDGKPVQPIANADGTPFVIQVMKYGDDIASIQV